MKLIEFEGEIVTVGEGGVVIKRDDDTCLRGTTIRSTVPEEQACGARLYTRVRVTVEAIEDEPAAPEAKP